MPRILFLSFVADVSLGVCRFWILFVHGDTNLFPDYGYPCCVEKVLLNKTILGPVLLRFSRYNWKIFSRNIREAILSIDTDIKSPLGEG